MEEIDQIQVSIAGQNKRRLQVVCTNMISGLQVYYICSVVDMCILYPGFVHSRKFRFHLPDLNLVIKISSEMPKAKKICKYTFEFDKQKLTDKL